MKDTTTIKSDRPQTERAASARARLYCLACLLTLAMAATGAFAQSYSIDWWTVPGGGGTSSGGAFSLSGSIGQPGAGTAMTNGQFSLTGGFWALPMVVQTPNAPALTIVPAGPGQATLSWAPNTPGFVLQSTLTLNPPAWADAPTGATNPVVVPATLPAKFYRLFRP